METAQRKGQRKGDCTENGTEKGRLHRERDREREIVSSPLLVVLEVLHLVVRRKIRWNRAICQRRPNVPTGRERMGYIHSQKTTTTKTTTTTTKKK